MVPLVVETCWLSTDPLRLPIEDIVDLLNLCLTSSYFRYNGKHYKQLQCTAIGSPVFVVVIEVVMQNIQESALVVFLATTKSQLFRQIFEVDIDQDLSIKITQVTFFRQDWLFFRCDWLSFVLGIRCDLKKKIVRFMNKSYQLERIRLHGPPVISKWV